MPTDLQIIRLHGEQIRPYLPDLARLRITVFRDWPYLYEGSETYESAYLQRYASCPESTLVLALDGDHVVGASTAKPLDQEMPEFQTPFREAGLEPADYYYLGESVLLAAYRGRGVGHRFFDGREATAAELERIRYTTFCAVDRAPDDPRRPPDYRPLDAFWQKRGYRRHADLQAHLAWQEIGQPAESKKSLSFWIRPLG